MLNQEHQKQAISRINKINGQVSGLKKMVEEPRYCVEILNQIAAIRAALLGLGGVILEDHLKTCVTSSIKKGSGEREIKELINIFKKF